MLLGKDFDEFFVDTIKALRPYLDEVVCLGGCANALYRKARMPCPDAHSLQPHCWPASEAVLSW